MHPSINTSILCWLLIFNFGVFSEVLEEGDQCSLSDGSQGVCKFLTQCEAALESLKTGKSPQICSFVGTQTIICCQSMAEPTRAPGDVSKQKCQEYAEYAYDRSEAPILLLETRYLETLECPFEKLELIVGGSKASRNEFPHMALVGYNSELGIKWGCGGSLINENFVLTAAHCLRLRNLPASVVRLGITSRSDMTNLQQITVSDIISHPEYVRKKKYHDIGLLKLSKSAELNIYVRPACLQTEMNIPNEKAIASGWGAVEYSGQSSNDLLKVVLELFPTDKCNDTYKRKIELRNSEIKDGILEETMLCAGSHTEIKDTCEGDSGGPLQIYHEETQDIKCMYTIVGITSLGRACGVTTNAPGIYARVSAYIKWIEDIVWPDM